MFTCFTKFICAWKDFEVQATCHKAHTVLLFLQPSFCAAKKRTWKCFTEKEQMTTPNPLAWTLVNFRVREDVSRCAELHWKCLLWSVTIWKHRHACVVMTLLEVTSLVQIRRHISHVSANLITNFIFCH